MRSFHVEAFVLRLRPLGESDRIVHLFSRERGKLHAVAKGARRPKSKFGARLDFFSRSQLTLHVGRSLHIITAARTVTDAWQQVVDPEVFAFVSYVTEVVDGLCELDMPVDELYSLLCELQEALIAGTDPAALAAPFDARLLTALGLAPELDSCARCGAPLGTRPLARGRARLSPDAGGLICSRCAADAAAGVVLSDVMELGAACFRALRHMRGMPLAEGAAIDLSPASRRRLARVTHAFVQYHLGRASRSLQAAAGIGARA